MRNFDECYTSADCRRFVELIAVFALGFCTALWLKAVPQHGGAYINFACTTAVTFVAGISPCLLATSIVHGIGAFVLFLFGQPITVCKSIHEPPHSTDEAYNQVIRDQETRMELQRIRQQAPINEAISLNPMQLRSSNGK